MIGAYLRHRQSLRHIRSLGRVSRREMRSTARADRRIKVLETMPPTRLGRAEMRGQQIAGVVGSVVTVASAADALVRMWRERNATAQPTPTPQQAGGDDNIPVF
ncbi:MAG: hypothetical protein WBB39_03130 [Candidatus Saccharimonadales bacterium]